MHWNSLLMILCCRYLYIWVQCYAPVQQSSMRTCGNSTLNGNNVALGAAIVFLFSFICARFAQFSRPSFAFHLPDGVWYWFKKQANKQTTSINDMCVRGALKCLTALPRWMPHTTDRCTNHHHTHAKQNIIITWPRQNSRSVQTYKQVTDVIYSIL